MCICQVLSIHLSIYWLTKRILSSRLLETTSVTFSLDMVRQTIRSFVIHEIICLLVCVLVVQKVIFSLLTSCQNIVALYLYSWLSSKYTFKYPKLYITVHDVTWRQSLVDPFRKKIKYLTTTWPSVHKISVQYISWPKGRKTLHLCIKQIMLTWVIINTLYFMWQILNYLKILIFSWYYLSPLATWSIRAFVPLATGRRVQSGL